MKKNYFLLILWLGLWIFAWYKLWCSLPNTEVEDVLSTWSVFPITGTTIGPISGSLLTGSTGQSITGAITPLIDTGTVSTGSTPACFSGVAVHFTFKQDFVDTYRYEDAKNYCFAMKIYYNDEDLGYYDTYRNENNGVSNSKKQNLEGCIPAYKVNDGYSILLKFGDTIRVAKPKNNYGFAYTTLPSDFDLYRFEFSPVKETSDVIEREKEFIDCTY